MYDPWSLAFPLSLRHNRPVVLRGLRLVNNMGLAHVAGKASLKCGPQRNESCFYSLEFWHCRHAPLETDGDGINLEQISKKWPKTRSTVCSGLPMKQIPKGDSLRIGSAAQVKVGWQKKWTRYSKTTYQHFPLLERRPDQRYTAGYHAGSKG